MLRMISVICLITGAMSKNPCCFASKAHTDVRQTIGTALQGKAYITTQTGTSDFDFSQKVASYKYTSTTNGYVTSAHMIFDYTNHVSYTIDGKTGKCTKAPYTKPLPNCLPSTAKLVNSGMFGYGSKSLAYDVWEMPAKTNNQTEYYTVTAKSCVPLFVETYGPVNSPDSYFISSEFILNSTDAPDESMLKIPASCNQAIFEPPAPEIIENAPKRLGIFA